MSIAGGKAGENTLNARLATDLRARGFQTADFELIFPTLKGIAKPDVVFETGRGIAIVSAKMGCDKEVDALSTAQEYQQSVGASENLAETFAVVYPRERERRYILRALATSHHNSLSWSFQKLEDLTTKIAEVVSQDWGKASRDIDRPHEAAIRVLRSGVNALANSLTGVSVEDFKFLFGGSHLFESILSYDESAQRSEKELLRSAAAYLFVNQILFYEILARELKEEFPEIKKEDYDRPDALYPQYFQRVLRKDYTPIFGFDIAGKLVPSKARSACKKIILSIKALFPEKMDHDLVGKVFHNLIPLDVRKRVAAYFTNSQAADLLARLAIESDDDVVLDPACGSGTLLVSSYKQKLRLRGGSQTAAIHRRYVESDLTGIDIMPFSAHLAAVHLALLAPIYETENVRIAIEDSTEHYPGDKIEPVRQQLKTVFQTRKLTDWMEGMSKEEKKLLKGALSLGEKPRQLKLEKVDVVIMNPPFTSNDNLPKEYKDDLEKRFSSSEAYKKCITGKLSFQAFFLLLADRFLKDNGRVAAVLPINTLVAKAFNELTEFFIKNYQVQYIIYGKGRAAFSENTALTEILFTAQKRKPAPDQKFVLVGVNGSPTSWTEEQILQLNDTIRKSSKTGKDITTDLCSSRIFLQESLSQHKEGLGGLIAQMGSGSVGIQDSIDEIYRKSKIMGTFKELEDVLHYDIFAYELRIKGGQYYGFSALSVCDSIERMKKKSDVFVFHKDDGTKIQIKNRFSGESHAIPKQFLCQQVRRLSGISQLDISNLREYVVTRPFSGVDRLLQSVYSQTDAEKFSARIKKDWEGKIAKGRSYIVLARRIDLAAPGTRVLAVCSDQLFFISANAWGIRNLSGDQAKIVTLWFNSSLFLLDFLAKRAQTRGTWGQIDERYLLRMPVPRLDLLTPKQTLSLVKTFDELNTKPTQFPSLIKQLQDGFSGRKTIDKAFLSVLGFSDASMIEKLLNELYSDLAGKILALKQTMH